LGDADGVEAVDRGFECGDATVEGVVAGGGAVVETGRSECVDGFCGDAVAGVGAVLLAGWGDGCLEVADGEVGTGDERLEMGEHRAEVGWWCCGVVVGVVEFGGAGVALCLSPQGCMHEHVTGEGNRDWSGGECGGGRAG